MNIIEDCITLNNHTNNQNEENIILIKYLLLSILSGIVLLSLIGLINWSMIKTSFSQQLNNGYFSLPQDPDRCNITGPSECRKSVFPTNLFLNSFNEIEKLYKYSPNIRQELYQKLTKCFIKYIPTHIIPNIIME